jgi:hypothetical protein
MRLQRLLIASLTCGFAASVFAGDAAKPPLLVNPLPDGWVAKSPTVKAAKQFAANGENNAFFELIEEPASDFSDNLDLAGYAKIVQRVAAAKSKLINRTETQIKPGKIGGRDTVEYEVMGEFNGLKLHYRFLFARIGDEFCELSCWTTPSHWNDSQADFETLVSNLSPTK